MIVRKVINIYEPLTEEQKAEIEAIRNMRDEDIVFDEDCPELTDEQLSKFKRVYPLKEKAVG